jgi:hypothetical protein
MALIVALFISNVVVVSCAMAYALCSDCPEHVSAPCVDPCAVTDVAIKAKTGDTKLDVHRPPVHSYTVLPVEPLSKPGIITVVRHAREHHHHSPPLRLQFCVFLT